MFRRSLNGLFRSASATAAAQQNRATSSAVFEFSPTLLYLLEKGPPSSGTVTSEEAEKYYREMQTIRRMELKADQLYKQKIIRGFCHLYDGQEACCVGFETSLLPTDDVITSYRAHGWVYMRGTPVHEVLAELFGRRLGCADGKGGSMHMYSDNFYGGNGIVGAQVPLGAGLALNHQYNSTGGCAVAIYGDGASNQGQIFEAYNIAKLWNLPVIFVCENNEYGMGTSTDRHAASTEFYKRGHYIPGIQIDGMDVIAVRESTKFAKQYVLENGPILLELKTYRYHGHSMSDPGTSYRTRDEVKQMRNRSDPIVQFRKKCLSAGLMTAEKVKELDKEVKQHVEEETAKALASPEPDMDVIADHIIKTDKPVLVRSCNRFQYYTQRPNM